ncbi:MAG: hypothetical protein A2600_04885 [Candidatus Lambdaproteobacteria bacterium RIFOXYD1_FULL_56_27]|uniref:Sulfatase-modifying factor enzyme-like domain-containing protein n=1 Tax=Candidatus Lambdaproteobacteria bacterium RIFOXYD2_FULL_56_26 TaxID=1817773 RepID=A0A1F6H3Y9_9PROT|nr:MAG: hypothetical protein A2426_13950 [Candidatus Lambdaproteobacteria bacterium RIFOXYC1_FULL_56_13]OGH05088.1 MAG: hypothetical protein A2557_08950 [Candidatus Lambdaproteobacteria bacterium RIFOXYD2_FULL_56_26]OGH09553.1 MAG: hypothetical protein A2600_04885 [Candidatus Lambdaproteobacteria bacterium RIFOXYD1_FULL_56_27]
MRLYFKLKLKPNVNLKPVLLTVLLLSLGGCAKPLSEQFLEQKAGGGSYPAADFRNWDLRHFDFSKSDLHEANLRYTDLTGAQFVSSDLARADLRNTKLAQANFSQSNLPLARLFEADLTFGIYDQINWQGYNFKNARLRGASFKNSNLRDVDFTGADLQEVDLSGNDLRFSRFGFTQLQKAKFVGSNLAGMEFMDRDFSGADFQKANLTGTRFFRCNLKGASFEGAKLVKTSFEASELEGVDFSAVYLDAVVFKNAHLPRPVFARAQLNRIAFGQLDFSAGNFRSAWLKGVSFVGTNLSDTDFSYATLEDTLLRDSKLTRANLTQTDFSKALLYKTDFTGVTFTKALFPTITEEKTQMEFVQAPMGCYTMGDLFGEERGFSTEPHLVCVEDFFIAKKEVTQAQFVQLMGYNPSTHQDKTMVLPVENLSAQEVEKFVAAYAQATGWPVRLPKEAEWEYACRDLGGKVRFGNGQDVANPTQMAYNGSLEEGSQRRMLKEDGPIHKGRLAWKETVPVGMFGPNNLGIFDLSGNVAELVADPWNSKAYGNLSPKPVLGPSAAQVIRGGHFEGAAAELRCSKRTFITAEEMDRRVGFRLARDIVLKDLENSDRFQLDNR